jgi:hypothetical protein
MELGGASNPDHVAWMSRRLDRSRTPATRRSLGRESQESWCGECHLSSRYHRFKAAKRRNAVAWGVSPRNRGAVSETRFPVAMRRPPAAVPALRLGEGRGPQRAGQEVGDINQPFASWGSRPRLRPFALLRGLRNGEPSCARQVLRQLGRSRTCRFLMRPGPGRRPNPTEYSAVG